MCFIDFRQVYDSIFQNKQVKTFNYIFIIYINIFMNIIQDNNIHNKIKFRMYVLVLLLLLKQGLFILHYALEDLFKLKLIFKKIRKICFALKKRGQIYERILEN